jgi:precorrin-6A/cobalt-precorrin-6A reductase
MVARLIEAPGIELGHIQWLDDGPPYRLNDERKLFDAYGFTHLVTKNSGGERTWPKMVVAQERGVQVIMVARPVYGPAVEVGTVEDAVAAVVR